MVINAFSHDAPLMYPYPGTPLQHQSVHQPLGEKFMLSGTRKQENSPTTDKNPEFCFYL